MRSAGAALLALLVVAAGCAAPLGPGGPATDAPPATPPPTPTATDAPPTPTSTPSPTPTPTPTPERTPTPRSGGKVTVEGQALSFDAAEVYRRVVRLLGMDYAGAPPVTVHVRDRPAPGRRSQVWEETAFMRLWGFERSRMGNTSIAGLTTGRHGRQVYLYAGVVTAAERRRAVLAHEFVHVLQHEVDAFRRIRRGVRGGDGNARRVAVAVVEGTAAYVGSRYADRYLDVRPGRRTWAAISRNRSRFGAYAVAPYYFGPRYVDRRVDGPADLAAVYDDPPTTTEQLLHGPDEEPARPLSVRAEAEGWYRDDSRTKGELFVRLVLAGELDGERAATAAAGWGADRLLVFREFGAERVGHAWVLRWDAPAEADEFEAALGAYLDRRGERRGGRWLVGDDAVVLRRAGGGTVVVVAGPPGFVGNTSVSGAGGDVTVTVAG